MKTLSIVLAAACLSSFTHAQSIRPEGQNWSENLQNQFYFTPQGSKIIPYDWAILLPTRDEGKKFFSSENLAQYGYIPQAKNVLNADGLPVGFMRDENPGGFSRRDEIFGQVPEYAKMPQLGINCAACHTSELSYRGTKIRINGGPSYSNFQVFIEDMDQAIALVATQNNVGEANFERYSRFAAAYYARSTKKDINKLDPGVKTRWLADLRKKLTEFSNERVEWEQSNGHVKSGVDYGPVRNDAFGIIFNQSLGHFLNSKSNIRPPNAPVKYPVIWDSPYHEVVQWVGIARNSADSGGPIARNIGQVLGVFGHSEVGEKSLVKGYCTSAKRKNLGELEDWIRTLKSPTWPKEVFGFDVAKAERGQKHYQQNCAGCHQLNERNPEDTAAHLKALGITNFAVSVPISGAEKKANEQMISIDTLGTDPLTASNAYSRTAETGPLQGRPLKVLAGRALESVEPAATVLRHVVAGSILGSFSNITCANTPIDNAANVGLAKKLMAGLLGFTKEDSDPPNLTERVAAFKEALSKYKARALNGLWAAPPYLHNGSVRSLKQLLTPPEQREKDFAFNCNEFDPIEVGLNCQGGVDEHNRLGKNDFKYDSTLPGNSNAGHDFGTKLGDDEKMELIEYIKAL
jgi:mono/diheme cytochrome c family protein